MPLPQFASPHVHVQSLDTASTPEKFAARELELGSGVFTVTDHGGLPACGAVYKLAKEKNLIPILGVEAYLRDDDCPILARAGLERQVFDPNGTPADRDNAERYPRGTYRKVFKYGHLCLHAPTQAAYEALVLRISLADGRAEQHGTERKPLFAWNDLEELAGYGVTMTSGCLIGAVGRHLLDRDDLDTAIAYYERIRGIAGPGRFFVEMFPHDCSRNWVDGVFVTVAADPVQEGAYPGDAPPKAQEKLRYYAGKKLLVQREPGAPTEEMAAEDLARLKAGGKGWLLVGRKDRRVAIEMEPRVIQEVEQVRDFVENECRPWAHGTPDIQAAINRFMLAMARRYKDPILVSDDAHYARPEEKILQELRLAQSSAGLRFWGSYHRYSSDEAYAHFRHTLGTTTAEFEGWVDNSQRWAAMFKDFKLEYKPSLPTKFYPEDTLGELQRLIRLHGRMTWQDPVYRDRLKREIDMLHGNGTIDLLPYMFVAEEACRVAADAGVLGGLGRGSAAGLLLSYLLEITHVDPIRRKLSLERFLTTDRIKSGKLPDIDLDYANRDVLVKPGEGWLFKRFGDHAIQISTVSKAKLRQACQDAARFRMGFVPDDVMRLTHKFEEAPQNVDDHDFVFGYETDDGTEIEGSIKRDPALQEFATRYADLFKLVTDVMGLPRSIGRHPCGHVVANRPIREFIPTTSVGGVPVTGYSAGAVEEAGGVKMDFLRVLALADVQVCLQLIQQRSGVEIPAETYLDGKRVPGLRLVPYQGRFYDVYDLPEDPEVAAGVAAGDTETVFQFHTPTATHLLKQNFNYPRADGRHMVQEIDDLAVFTALARPGPLDKLVANPDVPTQSHNMLVEFSRRARGLAPSLEVPPFMRELFPETHGIMVFQEQLQRAYQELTGCTGAQAEEFRGWAAKKLVKKMEGAWSFYFPRASARLGEDNSRKAWEFFVTFARYSFNRSHAFCYAQTGMICAWLKTKFPLEWWCAVLRNAVQKDKNEVTEVFWTHCGHLVDLPDLTRGGETFEIHDERIVAPVQLLKGVGPKALEELIGQGPYLSNAELPDAVRHFVERIWHGCTARGVWTEKPPTAAQLKKNPDAPARAVFKPGRSAVNAGIVSKLIAAGAMDRMFDETCPDLLSKVQRFLDVFQQVTGKKITKKQREALHDQYADLGPLGRYLRRREVLPVYSEDLRPAAALIPAAHISGRGGDYQRYGRPVVSAHALQLGEEMKTLPAEGLSVAVVGVVTEIKTWRIKANGRTGTRVFLDVEGKTFNFVGWPTEDGEPPIFLQGDLQGAVVVVSLSRRKVRYGFSLDDLQVLDRLGAAKDQEEESEDDDAG